MTYPNQRTLANSIQLQGVGVHTGAFSRLSILPAEPDSGIQVRRSDLAGTPAFPVDLSHVRDTELGTTVGEGEVTVRTVEHAMAALAAWGIDNAILELDGPELPILDGSFQGYFQALAEAGVQEQEARKRIIRLQEPLTLRLETGEFYAASPSAEFRVSASIDFPHPAVARQFGTYAAWGETFGRELAPARTFGFQAEVEGLRARGMALGASFENTLVLGQEGLLNGPLRFPDEFLRHKVGDIVGDLALLGGGLELHVMADRPSHRGNVALGRAIQKAVARAAGAPIVDIQKIMEYLPHRFPMLLVDRIVEVESGKRIVGIKNVTINEPFFQGHFPGHPIMPGVLIIEAMGQVGGLLLMDAVEKPENYVVYFMALDNVRWRRPVVPGDQIVFELEMLQFRRHVCKMRGRGFVEGQLVAEAELMARIVER